MNLSHLIWVQNNSIDRRTAFIFPLATWCSMQFRIKVDRNQYFHTERNGKRKRELGPISAL